MSLVVEENVEQHNSHLNDPSELVVHEDEPARRLDTPSITQYFAHNSLVLVMSSNNASYSQVEVAREAQSYTDNNVALAQEELAKELAFWQ